MEHEGTDLSLISLRTLHPPPTGHDDRLEAGDGELGLRQAQGRWSHGANTHSLTPLRVVLVPQSPRSLPWLRLCSTFAPLLSTRRLPFQGGTHLFGCRRKHGVGPRGARFFGD